MGCSLSNIDSRCEGEVPPADPQVSGALHVVRGLESSVAEGGTCAGRAPRAGPAEGVGLRPIFDPGP